MMTLHRLASTARGRREELGLSQQDLASRIGVSRNLVSRFETAQGATSIAAVLRILDTLGLSLDFVPSSRPDEAIDLDALLEDPRP